MNNNLAPILKEMASDRQEIRELGYQQLIALGKDDVQFYIDLLDLGHKHSSVRNTAAYELKRLGDVRALVPLMNYILNPDHINYNGSMVYALEAFDCSSYFKELFQILFYHGEEAKMSAQMLLLDQKFAFNDNDLLQIKSMWVQCKSNPDLCPGFDSWSESIEMTVDSYISYLEE